MQSKSKNKIWIAYPSYDSRAFISAYNHLQDAMKTTRLCQVVNFESMMNDSYIDRIRCIQQTMFLEDSDADWYFQISQDIVPYNTTPEDNIFDRLVKWEMPFIGGQYATSGDPVRCTSVTHDGSWPEDISYDSGLVEVRWLSGGCLMAHRDVFKNIDLRSPPQTYQDDLRFPGRHIRGYSLGYIKEVGTPEKPYKKLLTDDYAFCERYHEAAGEIFVDTGIKLGHIGTKTYMLWE